MVKDFTVPIARDPEDWEPRRFFDLIRDEASTLVEGLHLFKKGATSVVWYLFESENWALSRGRTAMTFGAVWPSSGSWTLELTPEELPELADFIEDFWGQEVHSKLRVFSRRFLYSAQRQDLGDRLIDLVTAAESIFLRGVNDELKYRLSLRAAFWLANTAAERAEVFETFRRAYDERSKVVHGEELVPRGRGVDPDELIERLEEYLRAAGKKFVNHYSGQSSGEPDWDALVLAGAPEDADGSP